MRKNNKIYCSNKRKYSVQRICSMCGDILVFDVYDIKKEQWFPRIVLKENFSIYLDKVEQPHVRYVDAFALSNFPGLRTHADVCIECLEKHVSQEFIEFLHRKTKKVKI